MGVRRWSNSALHERVKESDDDLRSRYDSMHSTQIVCLLGSYLFSSSYKRFKLWIPRSWSQKRISPYTPWRRLPSAHVNHEQSPDRNRSWSHQLLTPAPNTVCMAYIRIRLKARIHSYVHACTYLYMHTFYDCKYANDTVFNKLCPALLPLPLPAEMCAP